MMISSSISVGEALARLKSEKTLEGYSIDFTGVKIKALDAFYLGKAGIDVPDEIIEYDDAEVAHDPEFDGYEWKRVNENPLSEGKEKLTVSIKLDKKIKNWIKNNGIEIDDLLEKLVQDFYSSNQLIKGR